MSRPCDTCPDPGYCCRGFKLNIPTRRDRWKADARVRLRKDNLPFIPIEPIGPDHFQHFTHVKCSCPKLGPDGRCMDYANRPWLCREYQPYTDPNCILFVGPPAPPLV